MDAEKIGKLIFEGRTKKGMTQAQLAEKINVSDKAVSKWECGNGCPDITLISDISKVLEIDIVSLLSGELRKNRFSGGNMKNIQFYVCKSCKNVVTATNPVQLSCCGKILEPVRISGTMKAAVKDCGGEFYVQFEHEMTKENYVSAVFAVYYDRVLAIPMFAEQEASFGVNQVSGAEFYAVDCDNNGFKLEMSPAR
ncbi:MAG: helix-turn-helix domain-containing protein [Treponema sp.]